MSRRVSRSAATFLALTIALSTPSAFAARRGPSMDPSSGPIERIIRVIKKAVKSLGQTTQEDNPGYLPRPPLP
jgi:hypothetical protein